MTIGTPRSLGSSSASSGASPTLTTAAAINQGDLAFVAVFAIKASTVCSVTSISDGTNSYTKVAATDDAGANGNRWELWYCGNCAAVSSSATITVNLNSTSTACHILAAACAGLVSAPLDANPAGAFVSSALLNPVSTGALGQDLELVILAAADFRGNVTETATGFTNINTTTIAGNGSCFLDFQKVTSAASVTGAPSWSGSAGELFTIVASFKGVPLNGWLVLPEERRPTARQPQPDNLIAECPQPITQNFVTFQNGWMYIPDEFPPRRPWYKEQMPAWNPQPITQLGVPTQNGWMYVADEYPPRKPLYREAPFTLPLLKSTLPVPISGTPLPPPCDDQPRPVPYYKRVSPPPAFAPQSIPNPVTPTAPKFIRNVDPVLNQIRQTQPVLER